MDISPEGPMAIPLWINGHALLTVGCGFFDVPNSVTGEAIHRVPLCGSAEAAEAVAAARAAQPLWAEMGVVARRLCLGRLADALEGYAGHFVKLLDQEIVGNETEAEVVATVAALRAAAFGETGVLGLVLDASRPLASFAKVVAPALMAGATVVVIPSPQAPSAIYALCELSARVEWPAGVLNLLHGDTGAIEGLCAADIDRLVYAGQAELGLKVGTIAEAAGMPYFTSLA